ncbi:hypothetical protein [Flavobacterium rhizosphaerae]|uniref:Uncharacterized protein n=1 Tax=Flavobacterium rhizosphaerae TaxID=3163298 RepID=A0ABW8YZ61_9FLAO
MDAATYIPNAGRLPVLGSLPALLRQPVQQLGQLPDVDSVISNVGHAVTDVMVMFTWGSDNYSQALKCFRGLKPKRIEVNKEYHYLMVSVIKLNDI